MTDIGSSYTLSGGHRRRTIHRPTKTPKSRNSEYAPETPQRASTTKHTSSKSYHTSSKVSHGLNHGNIYYPRGPTWEDFDTLATDKSDDDVQTAITRMSMVSDYKQNKPKMMPDAKNVGSKTDRKRTSSNRRFTSSPLKGRQFNYKPKLDEELYQVKEVEVVYEEMSSVNNINEAKKGNYNDAKRHQKFDSPRRSNVYAKAARNNTFKETNDEYLVEMDRSFGKDVKAAANKPSKLNRVGSNLNTIQIDHKEDNTLDLSPIHRSNASFSERSFDVDDNGMTYLRSLHKYIT
jgi:hypothetical protein